MVTNTLRKPTRHYIIQLYVTTKSLTREHRGSGSRTKVSPQTTILKKWEDFLRDSKNKTEGFAFLTEKVTSMVIPESKMFFITSGMCLHRILHQCTLTPNAIDLLVDEKALCIGSEKEMATFDHEEADTRNVLHVHDSLERG